MISAENGDLSRQINSFLCFIIINVTFALLLDKLTKFWLEHFSSYTPLQLHIQILRDNDF